MIPQLEIICLIYDTSSGVDALQELRQNWKPETLFVLIY